MLHRGTGSKVLLIKIMMVKEFLFYIRTSKDIYHVQCTLHLPSCLYTDFQVACLQSDKILTHNKLI